jgi:hypothetical protein
MHAQYELLCGGPLDGLAVLAERQQVYTPSGSVIQEYPGAAGSIYRRRSDDRLYIEFCRWDAR